MNQRKNRTKEKIKERIKLKKKIKLCLLFQDMSEFKCDTGKPPVYVPHKPVTAVIGASFSVVSIMIANILRLFKVSSI